MSKQLWIGGFPSYYGGADTELDHLVDLWRAHGVEVHFVLMGTPDERMRRSVIERGCAIHAYRDDIFQSKVVASFCNSDFLNRLPSIMDAGRPARVLWFNSMTWLFDEERRAHALGWIDDFGFVSDYQKNWLLPQLEAIRQPARAFDYRPYFNASRIEWRYRPWEGCYKLGRISRDDGQKFAPDTWRIFDRVLVPSTLRKKVYILGYGPNAAERIGPAPASLDWRTWSPNEIMSSAFFRTIDTMIHKTGGSRESYGRVLIEAYAHGVVPIVERDYAFPELVVHGETGFMTTDSDEMSYYASELAWNPSLHRRIAENGRVHLEQRLIDTDACWRSWEVLWPS